MLRTTTAIMFAVTTVLATTHASNADITYHPLNFSSNYNYNLQNMIPGCPEGSVSFGGVPFQIAQSTNNTWDGETASPEPGLVSIDINVGLYGVKEIDTLLNTDWGTAGGPFAWIEFFGAGGSYYRKDLYAGEDIRDHSAYNRWADSINGTTTTNVWHNNLAGSGYAVLDKQKFVLPEAFANDTLETIRLSDDGQYYS